MQVEAGIGEDGKELLRPLLSVPMAEESLAEPAVTTVRIKSQDMLAYATSDMAPNEYRCPEKTIESTNDRPITIHDFVAAAHEHMQEHLQTILDRQRASWQPSRWMLEFEKWPFDDPAVYFHSVTSDVARDEATSMISSCVIALKGVDADILWGSQRRSAVELTKVREDYVALQDTVKDSEP